MQKQRNYSSQSLQVGSYLRPADNQTLDWVFVDQILPEGLVPQSLGCAKGLASELVLLRRLFRESQVVVHLGSAEDVSLAWGNCQAHWTRCSASQVYRPTRSP